MSDSLNLEEFEAMLDQLGPELAYWELPKADAGRRLLAASAPARALLKRARSLDNLLRPGSALTASSALRQRILADAEMLSRPEKTELGELMTSLWPFGPVWRPAAGLVTAAVFGVVVGATNLTQPLDPVDSVIAGAALTEEVISLAQLAGSELEDVE